MISTPPTTTTQSTGNDSAANWPSLCATCERPIGRIRGRSQAHRCFARCFPLTPALSLGERENRPPRFRQSRAPRLVAARDALFPLPEGETSELVCKHILKKIFTHLFSRGSRQSGVKIA